METKMQIIVMTPGTYSIMGQNIIDLYNVPDDQLLNFAKDASLRAYTYAGGVMLKVYGIPMERGEASDWLMRVASGNIIYGV